MSVVGQDEPGNRDGMCEQPYGPGAICEECGHFAERHDPQGCHWPERVCACPGMTWLGRVWLRPWLPAPEGLEPA